jgi:DNA-binding NarL/FixJ family response regulator
MSVRVHLADDHTMFREGLAAILASRGEGIEVVGQSSTGEEAIALVRRLEPDVVITQLEKRLEETERDLSEMREASPGSRIVVLTMLDNPRYLKAISGFIDAYVHKSSSAEELIATVGVLGRDPEGENVVVSMPRGMLQRLGEEPVGALSERETEVVVLASRGLSNRRIAAELHISEATVKRHLANVYAKIGVGSRNEAVRLALAEQWIGIHEITYHSEDGSDSSDGSSKGHDG